MSTQLDGFGGACCEDCGVATVHAGEIGRQGVRPWAADDALAGRLWHLSEKPSGASLP